MRQTILALKGLQRKVHVSATTAQIICFEPVAKSGIADNKRRNKEHKLYLYRQITRKNCSASIIIRNMSCRILKFACLSTYHAEFRDALGDIDTKPLFGLLCARCTSYRG